MKLKRQRNKYGEMPLDVIAHYRFRNPRDMRDEFYFYSQNPGTSKYFKKRSNALKRFFNNRREREIW